MDRLGPEDLFRRFYVRRLARIYPLAIVTVMFVLAMRVPVQPWLAYSAPDWRVIVENVLLVQNISGHESLLAPMWSLPFEVQMYAVLPVLFLLHTRRGISAVRIWGIGTLFSAALWLLPWKEPAELCVYIPCFCSGILAYPMLRQPRPMSFGLFAAGLAGTLAAAMAVHHLGVPLSGSDATAALGVGLILGRSSEVPAFVAKIAAAIAKYSYGIYLAHLPIMWFCFSGAHRRWVSFAPLSVCVPVALYHGIEHPFTAGLGRHKLLGSGRKWPAARFPQPRMRK